MKRKFVLAIAFLTLLLALSTGLTTNTQAATAPTHSPSPDFYTLEKTCAVIIVHLHGTQSPTMACDQAKTAVRVSPQTRTGSCSGSGITMEFDYNSFNQTICFTGTGYWGYRINDMNAVDSPTHTNGWFLWYYRGYSPANICNLNWSNGWGASSFTTGGTVDVTQIDPGTQNNKGVTCY